MGDLEKDLHVVEVELIELFEPIDSGNLTKLVNAGLKMYEAEYINILPYIGRLKKQYPAGKHRFNWFEYSSKIIILLRFYLRGNEIELNDSNSNVEIAQVIASFFARISALFRDGATFSGFRIDGGFYEHLQGHIEKSLLDVKKNVEYLKRRGILFSRDLVERRLALILETHGSELGESQKALLRRIMVSLIN